MATKPEVICLTMPCYGSPHPGAAKAFWARAVDPAGPHAGVTLAYDDRGSSLLGNGFDNLWATALNVQADRAARGEPPITHFAMLHADVCPQDWWLDRLLLDLAEGGADVMAALVPLKDLHGLTSTAIDDPSDEWDALRRITMAEAERLPEIFRAKDCGYPGHRLLTNTGCWACDFTKPWRFKVNFEIRNRVAFRTTTVPNHPSKTYSQEEVSDVWPLGPPSYAGSWITQVRPEDWEFARSVQRLGGDVACTRRVKLRHVGEFPFPNDDAWGTWETDEALARKCLTPILSDRPLIDGWLTEAEGRCLARLAQGKRVLEIGSWCGLSTVWMARTAASLTAVDPFDGRGTPEPRDTYSEFVANLVKHGVALKVRAVLRGTGREMEPQLTGEYDLAFIDGAHDAESVRIDAAVALRCLAPSGLIAFHDYASPTHPDVKVVVDGMLASNLEMVERVGSVLVARLGPVPQETVTILRPPLSSSSGASNGERNQDPASHEAAGIREALFAR